MCCLYNICFMFVVVYVIQCYDKVNITYEIMIDSLLEVAVEAAVEVVEAVATNVNIGSFFSSSEQKIKTDQTVIQIDNDNKEWKQYLLDQDVDLSQSILDINYQVVLFYKNNLVKNLKKDKYFEKLIKIRRQIYLFIQSSQLDTIESFQQKLHNLKLISDEFNNNSNLLTYISRMKKELSI